VRRRQARRAADRAEYLRRPGLGRRLAEADAQRLQALAADDPADLCVVLADGLSAWSSVL
jgi:ethanolamine ammonia-lyase small subunit